MLSHHSFSYSVRQGGDMPLAVISGTAAVLSSDIAGIVPPDSGNVNDSRLGLMIRRCIELSPRGPGARGDALTSLPSAPPLSGGDANSPGFGEGTCCF